MNTGNTCANHNSAGVGPKKIWYYFDGDIGTFSYGNMDHPMKPRRIQVTDSLIEAYGFKDKLICYRPHEPIGVDELTKFHSDSYIIFLKNIEEKDPKDSSRDFWKYNLGTECPVFPGLFEYSLLYSTGSIYGARRLNQKKADIAINWAGGMHHSRKEYNVGHSPINDCVLAILELLKVHKRVLYVDLDADHCSGVEEAFYTTDRVLTVSFHQFKENEYPGSGSMDDIGVGTGKGYSVNVPLRSGYGDETLLHLFNPIMDAIIKSFKPDCIVLQSGANSIGGDRYRNCNLTIEGHGQCLQYLKLLELPMLILGGGGSNIANVSRLWTYETGLLIGEEFPVAIPEHEFRELYGPDYTLLPDTGCQVDENDTYYIESLLKKILHQLKLIDIKKIKRN